MVEVENEELGEGQAIGVGYWYVRGAVDECGRGTGNWWFGGSSAHSKDRRTIYVYIYIYIYAEYELEGHNVYTVYLGLYSGLYTPARTESEKLSFEQRSFFTTKAYLVP